MSDPVMERFQAEIRELLEANQKLRGVQLPWGNPRNPASQSVTRRWHHCPHPTPYLFQKVTLQFPKLSLSLMFWWGGLVVSQNNAHSWNHNLQPPPPPNIGEVQLNMGGAHVSPRC